jgi:hypothetical protein
MLGILVWWAVPIAAVAVATLVAAIGRRVRRNRDDMFTTQRYERALTLLAHTQSPSATEGGERAMSGDVRVFSGPESDGTPPQAR